jgi:hypothetical protein
VAAVASTAAGSLLAEAIAAAVAVAVEAMRLTRCEQTAPLPYKVKTIFVVGTSSPVCKTTELRNGE